MVIIACDGWPTPLLVMNPPLHSIVIVKSQDSIPAVQMWVTKVVLLVAHSGKCVKHVLRCSHSRAVATVFTLR